MYTRKFRLAAYEAGTAQQVTVTPLTFVTEPYPCLEVGTGTGLVRVGIHQTVLDALGGASELGEVSVSRPKAGGDPKIIPFQPTDQPDRLLVLLDVSGGSNNPSPTEEGVAIYTAMTYDLVECPDRKRTYPAGHQASRCHHCGTVLQRGGPRPGASHPNIGEVRKWGKFSPAGVTILANGRSTPCRGAADAYRVILAIMDKGARIRIQRRGAITKGEPEVLMVCWNGKELLFSGDENESFNPPPVDLDLGEEEIL